MITIRSLLLGASALIALAAGSNTTAVTAAPAMAENPFAQPSTLPLHAPPFDKIKDTDYQPAIEEGMKQQLAEIDAIANSKEKPTFKNTVVAIEISGRMLDRATSAFFGVVQANTNDTLDKVQADEAPKLADHNDAIFLNEKLFQRVKAVYDARDTLKLDPESLQFLKITYNGLRPFGRPSVRF
ncbi:MAG: hypothetical protein WDM89_11700 [Rhizomicrobium sp.]